jgi:hypothetical protein
VTAPEAPAKLELSDAVLDRVAALVVALLRRREK